jgi:uncharacterized protein (TIGR02147 family)
VDSELLPSTTVDVFGYLDHRAYLADYFAHKQRRGLTYRGFSRRVGLGAPNYLKQIIDGHKRLSGKMAARFAQACGLSGDSAEYFCALVAFNHASNMEERNESFEALSAFRRYRAAHPLSLAQAAYYSNGYLPAIRELVVSPYFREDPVWIGRTLRPAIKPGEAKRAIATLLVLGLLARDPNGKLVQSHAVVSTGAQTRGLHIANYHAEMMQRATASMDLIPAAERDISALTMCVGDDALGKIKQRLQAFRRELIAIAEASTTRTQVVQLNLQLFPLSHRVQPAGDRDHKPY